MADGVLASRSEVPDELTPSRVYLGLGANLGDREANLRAALDQLDRAPGVRVLRVSSFSETAYIGDGPDQPSYLNGVAELDCSLPPHALLALCLSVERDAGRIRDAKFGHPTPRPIDLDVLLFGSLSIDTKNLVVPHPRMMQRPFVLDPLRELGVDLGTLPGRLGAPLDTLPGRLRAPSVPGSPRVCCRPEELRALHRGWLQGGCTVGLVPTMGALHAGHASLIERAVQECDRVSVTIFVNPKQFDAAADLESYPRTLEDDIALCARAGAHAVFAPESGTMYPDGFASHIAVGAEAQGMEGAYRGGHFEGVATVVAKLLGLARADRAYFGEKDAQQLAVVRRLTQDLDIGTAIVACDIVRQLDGLAMSSRNVRLTTEDRAAAVCLSEALRLASDAFASGERSKAALLDVARARLDAEPRCELDYLELREGELLAAIPDDAVLEPDAHPRALLAANFGSVRLIDNLWLRQGHQLEQGQMADHDGEQDA